MEFDKTRWSCPFNSDQNCTQTVGDVGVRGYWEGLGGVRGLGVLQVLGGGVRGLGGLGSVRGLWGRKWVI